MEPSSMAESHISVVFFVGDRAYKLKKPVRFDFVDLTSRERREEICHREVELNRRLAPDVYLGVSDVSSPDGSPCEHLVVMRRMPAERRLSTLIDQGAEVGACIDAVADQLASFHDSAERSAAVDACATAEAIRGLWHGNLDEMRPLDALGDADLDAVGRMADAYLDGRKPLFERRIAEGRIVDGHGDLLADDIFCLPDGPRILDCIEFEDTFRYGDMVADVAFLAMDLERIGAPELARRFLDRYRGASGDDLGPPSLLHHHIAYRALVRCKVASLRAGQGEQEARAEAHRLLGLCHDHLRRGRVRLVLVGGLPGTGKTTVASGLAESRGWSHLRSDVVRKELAGLSPTDPATSGWREGLYDDATTDATYEELLRRARADLEQGRTVVLDASWSSAERRSRAMQLAGDARAEAFSMRCELDPGAAAERIAERASRGGDASDATEDVAERMSGSFDPWPEAQTLRTDAPAEQVLSEALGLLQI